MTVQLKQFLSTSTSSASHHLSLSTFRQKTESLLKIVRCKEMKQALQCQKAEKNSLTNTCQNVHNRWWGQYRWWVERRNCEHRENLWSQITNYLKGRENSSDCGNLKARRVTFWSLEGLRFEVTDEQEEERSMDENFHSGKGQRSY